MVLPLLAYILTLSVPAISELGQDLNKMTSCENHSESLRVFVMSEHPKQELQECSLRTQQSRVLLKQVSQFSKS